MNIILTGAKRSGKSTAARKILFSLPGTVSGFITEIENRDGGTGQALYLRTLDGAKRQKAADWETGHARAILETFNEFAALLIKPDTDFVFIDELGFLERDASALREAVSTAFDGKQSVLAVVRLGARGWTQELKDRADVRVFELSVENRDTLPDEILRLLEK